MEYESELGFEYISRYFALRKAEKIGIIWSVGLTCLYSATGQMEHKSFAGPIPIERLRELIDYWFPRIKEQDPVIERIGVGSEKRLEIRKRYY